MRKLNTFSKEQIHTFLSKLLFLFIIVQPVFDVLSELYVKGIIPIGISTYGKPLFVGFLNIILVLVYRKHFWRCFAHYALFLLYAIVHIYLFSGLPAERYIVLSEIRHMLNLIYMLLCWHDVRILFEESFDKDSYIAKLTKSLLTCFGLYLLLYLLAVITGTSGTTYGATDPKIGFRGWFNNGQIFGHALCVCLPAILYFMIHNKFQNRWLKILCKLGIAVPLLVLTLVGTKVTFYIAVIVLAAQVVLELFFAVKDKQCSHAFNALLCAVFLAVCILAYPITPVYHNTAINGDTLADEYSDERMEAFLENERRIHLSNKDRVDYPWTEAAIEELEERFLSRTLHPSLLRQRQQVYNGTKFKAAPLLYKVFGVGYLNQNDMTLERDIMALLFGYGIIAFLLVMLRPLVIWFRSVFWILRRLFKTDLLTLCLFEGFSMFFFISFYAGYTFLFTQFSIFLTVIMCLLNHRVDKLKAMDANGRLPS